jgi:hypothetical protein
MAGTVKHTEGPWITHLDSDWSVDTDSGNSFVYVGPEGDDPVAIVLVGDSWAYDDELDANARLISAAPEMLSTLKMVSGLDLHHEVLRAVDTAIAKAGAKP